MRSLHRRTLWHALLAVLFATSAREVSTQNGGSKIDVPSSQACKDWANGKCDFWCSESGGCSYVATTWINTGYCSYQGWCTGS